MKNHEKALIVLLLGSLWGALELFGADSFRALGVPNKSAYLFGLSLVVMYVSKRAVDFAGSVIIMALIASLFKTASSAFYPCQCVAVLINGAIFDVTYRLSKRQLNSSPIYRTIAAPIIVYVSYALFSFTATYILQESNWAAEGLRGIGDYLITSALIASVVAIVAINIGYYLGNALKSVFSRGIRLSPAYFRIVSLVSVAAIWIAGQIYQG